MALFVLGLSRSALAQPLRLELDAPADCATRESVVREVERRVDAGARQISARASIQSFERGRSSESGGCCK
jgi:hypothetical protein